jgi:hypothetical protein
LVNLQSIFDVVWRDGSGNFLDTIGFPARIHATRQHDAISVRDNRDILGPKRERVVLHDGLPDSARRFDVIRRVRLIERRDPCLALLGYGGSIMGLASSRRR